MIRIKEILSVLGVLYALCINVSAQDTADSTFKEIEVEGVEVKSTVRGNYINSNSLMKSEIVGRIGLQKMACCTAAESLENSASVSVGSADGISGTKQIRMLGLNGMYTSLMSDGRTMARGINSPYMLGFTPGPWLSGIHISKGIAAVGTGTETITGHINMMNKLPTADEPLFLNAYIDQDLRSEFNVTSSLKLNENVATSILGHFAMEPLALDHNHDGFMDMPQGEFVTVGNNWDIYLPNSLTEITAGVKYAGDWNRGGQMLYDHDMARDAQPYWGMQSNIQMVDTYFRLAVPTDDQGSNFALTTSYNYFSNESFYGIKDYVGKQNSIAIDAKYFWNLSHSHRLMFGASGNFDIVDEYLTDVILTGSGTQTTVWDLSRNDIIAGIFAEYTYTLHKTLSVVAGVRLDYANFYGVYFTPRLHVNWKITPTTTLRASGGLGYRPSSILSDNMAVLATGREILFDQDIDRMERGASFGGSLTQTFKLLNDENASISVDVYHTQFYNQVIADQEYDEALVYFYNIQGGSWATAYQVDFNWSPFTRFDVLMTFRYNDTKIELANAQNPTTLQEVDKPLIDKFKGLINLQYATSFRKWVFDFTAQVNGQQRLPSTVVQDAGMDYSPVYPMLYAQVTKNFRKWNIYLGCENILNYRQDNPVLNPSTPFSQDFNASVVWGPLMGRKIYLGVRFNI